MKYTARMLTRSLIWNGALALAIAVIGGVIGYAVAGPEGLAGAVMGALLTAVFLGLTASSILLGSRVARGEMLHPAFFGIVMGGWLLKLILFVVVVLVLRGQDWIDPFTFFITVIVAVIGSLAVDVYAFMSSRIPYVSDVELPEAPADPQ